MTPQQIVGLGIRLLALWIAFKAIAYFFFTPIPLLEADVSTQQWGAYLLGAAYVIVALLFWVFPMWIAHKLTPRTQFENRLEIHALDAARVGCALIGLWLFSQALPNMTWFFFRAFLMAGNGSFFSSLNIDAKIEMALTVVQIFFALFLIIRSDVFARLIIRNPHLAKENNADEHSAKN